MKLLLIKNKFKKENAYFFMILNVQSVLKEKGSSFLKKCQHKWNKMVMKRKLESCKMVLA